MGATLRRLFLNLGFVAAAGLSACGGYDADIETVKQARSLGDQSNEELVKQIAGARGTIEWSGEPAAGFDNGEVVTVAAHIERTTRTGQKRLIVIEFIHNRQTETVALERLVVDGRPQNLLTGALNLFLMQLE